MEIRLAVSGFGNVGQGLATLIGRHGDEYEARYGVRLLLTGAADRAGGAVDRGGLESELLLAAKAEGGSVAACEGGRQGLAGAGFLDAAGADIFVEAASTNFEDAEPGWTYVREALARGMDVALASKGSLALHFGELMQRAKDADRSVRFSATVGAPLPSLEIAERGLLGTTISSFEGIVNATSHQILTAVASGASYEEGVRQAQALGIAETDPTLDVDGWDAAAKVAILANAIFGTNVTIHDVERTGIRGVTADQLRVADAAGESIKLIGRAERHGDTVTCRVAPERRPMRDALGRLTGEDMGFVFYTEPYGKVSTSVEPSGAGGGITTAMAVLRDVFIIARERATRQTPR